MNDLLPVYHVRADSGELGANGYLKLQGYHELLCRIIEADQTALGCSLSDTLGSGYAWAMVSLSMQVHEPVRSCGKLLAQTWLSEVQYPHLRREIELFTENDIPVLSASVFMVPLSTDTHKIQPENKLTACTFPVKPTYSVDWAQARMHTIHDQRYKPLDVRTVRPSDIDALGHLNNCRYGAFAYDALTALGKDVTGGAFIYTMHFMRQCMNGTRVSIGAYEDNGAVHLLGMGKDDKLKRFCAVLKSI